MKFPHKISTKTLKSKNNQNANISKFIQFSANTFTLNNGTFLYADLRKQAGCVKWR